MILNKERFMKEIQGILTGAKETNFSTVTINSGELHRKLGGYPGPKHRMPVCCDAMYDMMGNNDIIISSPPKGKGASLTIEYKLLNH